MARIALTKPTACAGEVVMPGDKSVSHRIVMLAAIARGQTEIVNLNRGEDVGRTTKAMTSVGAIVKPKEHALVVHGVDELHDPTDPIDCGNSGTTMRLLMGLLAGRVQATLDGDASLRRRPMERIAEPLRLMGAEIETSADGRAPVSLRGQAALRGIDFRAAVASAQLKSAVLFAGLHAEGATNVSVAIATRDHTERMLAAMHAPVGFGGPTVSIRRGELDAIPRYDVPGDLSAAAFFLTAAAALPGFQLVVRDVGINPTRGAVVDALRAMGAKISIRNARIAHDEPRADIEVRGGAHLRGISIGGSAVPALIDELPVLCALGAIAGGEFAVRGAGELRLKESDRLAATAAMLRAFGAEVEDLPDGLVVRRSSPLQAPELISAGGDHRIGMAAAALAAALRQPLVIDDAECIATSFPEFEKTWSQAFA